MRLLARALDAAVAETGLPPEQALELAFRRGLARIEGTDPLARTGDERLDDALESVAELEAAAVVNGWRVLQRLRHIEDLEPAVERGEAENQLLRKRLLGAQQVETLDVPAMARRLFSHREPKA